MHLQTRKRRLCFIHVSHAAEEESEKVVPVTKLEIAVSSNWVCWYGQTLTAPQHCCVGVYSFQIGWCYLLYIYTTRRWAHFGLKRAKCTIQRKLATRKNKHLEKQTSAISVNKQPHFGNKHSVRRKSQYIYIYSECICGRSKTRTDHVSQTRMCNARPSTICRKVWQFVVYVLDRYSVNLPQFTHSQPHTHTYTR